jgi:hypothetical protein
MSLHVWNLGLALEISDAVREIGVKLFSGPGPEVLHHYTSATTVEAIVQSRSMWATCIDDQADKTEISHASELVTQLAGATLSSRTSDFTADVMNRLPFFMEERKRWIYIACFCDDGNSGLHWREYGRYCLTFPAPWAGVPSLALSDNQAECWYQRVIYDEGLQKNAMKSALKSIVTAISRNTAGQNRGPWAQAMVDGCARNSAQLLLSLAVGFKRKSFKGEREWRIVCAPRLGTNSSAPASIDENFSVNVRQLPRRHLLLQSRREYTFFQPLLTAPVPFLQITRSPDHYDAQELDRINSILRTNDRADLCLLER